MQRILLDARGQRAANVPSVSGPPQGSTAAGMMLTLLFRLMRRSGRGRGCLVWISSSGVFPSGGSSLFLLLRVSGSHWGGSSNGPKPNCTTSSLSVGVAGATWEDEAYAVHGCAGDPRGGGGAGGALSNPLGWQ